MKRSQDRACGDKFAHATKKAAQAHMHALIRKGNVCLEVYRCPWCDQYHVGHRGRGRKWGRGKQTRR